MEACGTGDGKGDVTTPGPFVDNPTAASHQPKHPLSLQQSTANNPIVAPHITEGCQSQPGSTTTANVKYRPITTPKGPSPPVIAIPKITPVHCPKGTHNVVALGCVKIHLTKKEAFGLGCKLGFNDNPDQEAYIASGGHAHSTAFTAGYNLAFGNGKDPSPCNAYRNLRLCFGGYEI